MGERLDGRRKYRDSHRVQRAQLAQVVQLKNIDRLMLAMARLVAHGFAPLGFSQVPAGALTIHVEEPTDRMVDAARNGGLIGGRFSSEINQRWFIFDGVRVLWNAREEEGGA